MKSEVALNAQLDFFTTQVRRREIVGSGQIAIETAKLLRDVVGATKKSDNTRSMLKTVRAVGRRLTQAQPMALAIGNIVRRVLFIIREEYANVNANSVPQTQPTLHGLLSSTQTIDYTTQCDIKPNVIEAINDLIDEISHIHRSIASQATQHIHANEVILTYGTSRTVEEFLKEAAKKDRPFKVIVAENAPLCTGQQLALSLSKDGVSTTVIPDGAIISMMSRVNKVIIGTYAVMANGGILAPSGTHLIAVAAKQFSVPLVVCCGLYKLTPLYPTDQDSFNDKYSPSEVISDQEVSNIDQIPVYNPAFDYIPPEFINLFVTNEMFITSGGHNPSYIYRLLADHYNPEDYVL